MKKFLTVFLAMALVIGFASISAAGIQYSKHDLTSSYYTGVDITGTEICKFCHTPHNANANSTQGGPLWNRSDTVGGYTMYSSSTLDSTPNASGPRGPSLLCLSCHDGTQALDAYGGGASGDTIASTPAGSTANLGQNLTTTHPISITYDSDLANNIDGELNDPDVQTIGGSGGTITAEWLFTVNSDTHQLECASCHDVHAGPPGGYGAFLAKDNAGSGLCLTCHNK